MATLKVNAGYLFELMMFFAAELKESEKRMRNLAHMNTRGRVCNALLTLHEKFGVDKEGYIDLEISRQDLAAYTGATYETLFKMLNDLLQANAIRSDAKKIKIIDKKMLQSNC